MNTTLVQNNAAVNEFDLFGRVPDIQIKQSAARIPTQFINHQVTEAKADPQPDKETVALDDLELSLFNDNSQVTEAACSFIAKLMISRMVDDLGYKSENGDSDLFGQVAGERELNKQDALIWMFNLNPDGSAMSFEWACNETGLDHESLRSITARSTREDLKRILVLISSMVSLKYAQQCEAELLQYVNLTGWNLS